MIPTLIYSKYYKERAFLELVQCQYLFNKNNFSFNIMVFIKKVNISIESSKKNSSNSSKKLITKTKLCEKIKLLVLLD